MLPEFSLGAFIALQIGGLALFVSLAVTGFARLGGLGDVPDGRSAHSRTTPTAGGLGIVAGVGAAFLAAALFHADTLFAQPGTAQKLASLTAIAFALGLLGLVDDRIVVPTRLKFGLILLLSLFAANAVGSVTMLPFGKDHIYLLWWSGLAGTALWLFTVTNAVNFMDGINGLIGGSLAVASGALCALSVKAGAPVTALMSGAVCAALTGFLPYNFRVKAAVFCGDCGSLTAGFLYAASVLMLVHEQPEMRLLYAGPLLVMPLLADVLLTLARKPFVGIRLTAPHSTHVYQRAARTIGSHVVISLIYAGLAVLLAGLVHHAFGRGTLGSMLGLGMISGMFAALYAVAATNLRG